jgi:hypothetical protein
MVNIKSLIVLRTVPVANCKMAREGAVADSDLVFKGTCCQPWAFIAGLVDL